MRTVRMAGLALAVTAPAAGQSLDRFMAERLVTDERELSVHVTFGLADFRLTPERGVLYRTAVRYDPRRFDTGHRFDPSANRLELQLTPRDEQHDLEVRDQRIDLTVSPDVPLRVDLEFGAGRSEVDLGWTHLREATIRTGASRTTVLFSEATRGDCERLEIRLGAAEFDARHLGNSGCREIDVAGAAGAVTLDFTGEWPRTAMHADVTLGFGGLTLRLPRDVGVAVSLSRFLASFDRAGFQREGDRWISTGMANATRTLELDIRAVVGDIAIEWVN